MPKSLRADDILPLVASLTPIERARLLTIIASEKSDSSAYAATPSRSDEFQTDEDPLSWMQKAGISLLNRGEIRWYTFRLPDKRRPVLVLTRDEVVNAVNEIIVVPATRTIRRLQTEVILTEDDGMPTECALNFDHVALAEQDRFGSVLCTFPDHRWPEARTALLQACGFGVKQSN